MDNTCDSILSVLVVSIWRIVYVWLFDQSVLKYFHVYVSITSFINTLRLVENDWHFADDIIKIVFLIDNCCMLIEISQKFVLKSN